MKIRYKIILLMAFCILYSMNVSASTTLSITGIVKQPLNLSVEDLERFQTVRVQLNEVMKDLPALSLLTCNNIDDFI